MYQQERMDQIMKILKKYHYVTVDYLVKEIRYSPASIRRDLTLLQKQGLVVRSYGGVSVKDDRGTPFRFRQHSMRIEKNAIAKKAATLVKNGDTVYIDVSSTTQYIGHFLTEKKGITVVTGNMHLATYLYEHGIETYCTGGRVYEYPGLLGGELANGALSYFNGDIAFFSTQGINSSGVISGNENDKRRFIKMKENFSKVAYLCGSDKFNSNFKFNCCTLDEIDYFVSDKKLPKEITDKYKNTKYLCTTD